MSHTVPTVRLRPHLERAVERWGGVLSFAAAHKHLGIHERMVWTVMSGEYETVQARTADKLVTAIDPMLWHGELADLLPQRSGPVRPSGRLRMSEDELRSLNDAHVDGMTLHELGEQVWEQHGYASAVSAASCIRQAFDRRCWPCYPRIKGSPRRRPNSLLTEEQIASAWKIYQDGMSMGEIGRILWQAFGYKDAETCAKCLSQHFRNRGLRGRKYMHLGSRIDDRMAARLISMYEQGYSCPELGRMFWEELGYANAVACANSIRHRLIVDGIPRRPRGESVRLFNARHGSPLKGRMPAVVFGRRVELEEAA